MAGGDKWGEAFCETEPDINPKVEGIGRPGEGAV